MLHDAGCVSSINCCFGKAMLRFIFRSWEVARDDVRCILISQEPNVVDSQKWSEISRINISGLAFSNKNVHIALKRSQIVRFIAPMLRTTQGPEEVELWGPPGTWGAMITPTRAMHWIRSQQRPRQISRTAG